MKSFKEMIHVAENDEDKWDLLESNLYELDHNPCQGCGGKCCTGMYIDQGPFINGISEDHIKWAEAHETTTYRAKDLYGQERWGIYLNNKCKHLTDEGMCGIQETKPKACRDYFGLNPDGPFVECNLIRELIKTKQISYKPEWIKRLWPDEIPAELMTEGE
jgi:Fe-S-cluster containining protein